MIPNWEGWISLATHGEWLFEKHNAAQKSPPGANKFCVGAVLVDADNGKVLSTGYSLEYDFCAWMRARSMKAS
jgi:hypothetical protein